MTIFGELKEYVGFSSRDEAALRELHPVLAPQFARIVGTFYDRILENDGAREVLTQGESMVGRLKVTLMAWMDKLLTGPWDDAYFELRCRIGRVHVRIQMPQHYMFGAMNVIRRELDAAVPHATTAQREALSRIIDLELAIMLHTYREDLESAQARAERLATFGQLVGSIGHELRNPLGVIETSLYILKSRIRDDERAQKHLDRIAEQLSIANSIITDLLDMIRDRPLQRQRFAVAQLVEQAAAAVKMQAELRIELFDVPEVEGDPGQIRQVFVNLLDNAAHAAGENGRVRVTAVSDAREIAVAVEDTGPGVDEQTRRRLFEPLITTKQKGVGLGLALCKRIIERHGGTIAYDPGTSGARFVVRLPRADG